jgi:hypothetical protein
MASPLPDAPERPRAGFTLIEMVGAGAILALLAAITIPQVMDALDKKRINDTHELLQEIQYAFTNSDQTGFLNLVRSGANITQGGTIPGELAQLAQPISTTELNSCGVAFNNTAVTTWRTYGPFLMRPVSPVDGLRTPIGNIQNALSRSPATTQGTFTSPAFIRLQFTSVDSLDALALDKEVDGALGATAGSVQYTYPPGGGVTLFFVIPIGNRC